MLRVTLLSAFAVGVYLWGHHAPDTFQDPLVLASLALAAAFFGAAALRPAARRAVARHEPWRRRRPSGFDMLGRAALSLAIWAGLLGSVVVAYDNRDSLRNTALSALSALQPADAVTVSDRATVLTREHGGHFVATARVNGQQVRMLVDTGSSDVALPYDEALRLGVDTERLLFDSPVMTANGQAMVAPVVLPAVAVGSIVLNDVRASVAEPGKLGSALLGMSFLGHLSEVTLRGEKLILRQ